MKQPRKADLFGLVEIKTSIYPFKETLNLVIREDYGGKFKDVYVQNIINVKDGYRKEIVPGTQVIICGYQISYDWNAITFQDVDNKKVLKIPNNQLNCIGSPAYMDPPK